MKKLFTYGLAAMFVSLLFFSCGDGAIGDDFNETHYAPKGALLTPENVVNGFFDIADADNSFVSFDLNSKGEAVSNADLFVSYLDMDGNTLVGDALLSSVSNLPSNVTLTMNDVVSLLNLDVSTIKVGETIRVSFDASAASGKYRSSDNLDITFSCRSALGGTYDFVGSNLQAANGNPCPTGEVTGTVTFTDLGGGEYLTSDLGFGQYESSCWSDGPATSGNAKFTDVCNQITSGGLDQYNLTYTWTITDVSGANLSLSWFNNYGDSGDAVITRPDGTNWPALFTSL